VPRKGLEPFLSLKMEMLGTLLGSGGGRSCDAGRGVRNSGGGDCLVGGDRRNDGRVDGDGRGGGGRDDGGEAARPKEARAVLFALDGDVGHVAAHHVLRSS